MTSLPNTTEPVVVESRRKVAPHVSVIIVTWNCQALIGTCLDWLHASVADFPFEIIIVDNASTDDTRELLKARDDIDVLVLSTTNLGFGRGNNLGATYARGHLLLLLNPDAFLEDPTALGRLASALDTDARIAAVGPMLTNPDGSHQVGDAGHAPTLTHVAMHQLLVSRILAGVRGYYVNHPRDLAGAPVEVGWLGGACQMVRRSAFDAVSGFSAEIFMYGEDVDLGGRMCAMGWPIVYLPCIRVLHLQGATQKTAGELYVSTRWIDSLFASRATCVYNDWRRRLALRFILSTGFGLRAIFYSTRAALTRDARLWAKAKSMIIYMSHAIQVSQPSDRT